MKGRKENFRLDKVFLMANALLLAFGILAQILSELMGYTPMLSDYFLHLIPSVAAGLLACYWMIRLRNGGKTGKGILAVLLMIIMIWSVLVIGMLAFLQFEDSFQNEPYGNGWYFAWVNRKEEAQYMLSKCHLLGHGDGYYQYPEELIDPEVWVIDDLPQDVQNAMLERERAKVFRHFRWDMILPVLSYQYGFWITILFGVITALWCITAIQAFVTLHLWWEKVLFAVCGALIAEQMIFPLLGGMGILSCQVTHPFSMDWQMTLWAILPQLSVMFVLLKSGDG